MDHRPITTQINAHGHLTIGGCDITELAATYGTPLWIYDQATITHIAQLYQAAFNKYYDNFLPLYASKALCTIATTQLIDQVGFGFDVVSGGELYTVLKAGVNPQKIYFHGNNKSQDELQLAIESGIGRIVADNIYEIHRIQDIASQLNKTVNILIRVTPEVDAHTHEFIQTGQLDSKFGVPRAEVVPTIAQVKTMANIQLMGIHAHIGSQIFDAQPFGVATTKLCTLALAIRNELGVTLPEINVGGGLGIKYLEDDDPAAIDEFAALITSTLKLFCAENDYPLPRLLIEPGRSIVANAGVTAYTVGSQKDIPGIRTYLAVDGGMADNPRPIMYDAQYSAINASKANQLPSQTYTIAGKFCESGDVLIRNIDLAPVAIGDLLCVFTTGAYNFSMSSNYNRFRKPAMVMVNEGRSTLIVKRETYEDIIRNDLTLQ